MGKILQQNSADNLAGLQIDYLNKLRSGSLSFNQAKWWNNLLYEQRELVMGKSPGNLKLVTEGTGFFIDETDGYEKFTTSDAFGHISDFADYQKVLQSPIHQPKPKTPVNVYKIIKDSKFTQLFGGLSLDLNKLCFTESQIVNFVVKYPFWFNDNKGGTFFLLNLFGKYFIASVYFADGPEKNNIWLRLYKLDLSKPWMEKDNHFLITP